MQADRSPYPLGWYGTAFEGIGLDDVRANVGTYGAYDFGRLPTLPISLKGDFAWLAEAPIHAEWAIGAEGDHEKVAAQSTRLLAAEPQLPDELATFLLMPALHDRIRSTTACFLDICPCAVAAPHADGKLVRFLSDQQGCCFWYVYLAPDGDHAVVASGSHHGAPDEWIDDGPERPLIFVAETFETFLCRYWLENEIGFCLYEGEALPPLAQAYVERYRGAPAA